MAHWPVTPLDKDIVSGLENSVAEAANQILQIGTGMQLWAGPYKKVIWL